MERFHAVTVAIEQTEPPVLLPTFIIDAELNGCRTVADIDFMARKIVDAFGLFKTTVLVRPVTEIKYVPAPRAVNNGG